MVKYVCRIIYICLCACIQVCKQAAGTPDVFNLSCLVASMVKTSCDMDQDSSIAWGWHGATASYKAMLGLGGFGLTDDVCNGVGPAA
jgi:hypothetical protein